MITAAVVGVVGALVALRTAASRRPELAPVKAKAHRNNR